MKKKIIAMLTCLTFMGVIGHGTESATTETSAVLEAGSPKVEVVFVLDTTGSMSGLIAAAKEKIWAIANTLATAKPTPEIKMGLIGYRDRNDAYVTKQTQLTGDLDNVYAELMGFQAAGGGDTPESVNQALNEAVIKMKWSDSNDVYKVIFLVGDAPPHMDYQDDVKYQLSAKKSISKGIVVNTIQCGQLDGTQPVWQEIAKLADGSYFQVDQSGGAVHYKTPYDKDISELSRELDETRVYYGDGKERKKAELRMSKSKVISSTADSSAAAQRAEFNSSEAGLRNFLGDQELVDGVVSGAVKLDNIKEEKLPESMREMNAEERKEYVKELADKRSGLQKKILELTKKRQTNIAEQVKKQSKGGEDSFDMKVFKVLKKQAEEENIKLQDGPKY